MSDKKEGLMDSLLDAIKPGNVIIKIFLFLFFGLITATPYVIKNLDSVMSKVRESGASGVWVFIAYIKALLGAMWMGVGIGLSTVVNTIFHFKDVLANQMIGTMIFSVLVILFATATVYQPLRLLFNILDAKRGRKHSASTIVLISLVSVLVIAAPISYLVLGGETITSGVKEKDVVDSDFNESLVVNDSSSNSSIVNSLNMLKGG